MEVNYKHHYDEMLRCAKRIVNNDTNLKYHVLINLFCHHALECTFSFHIRESELYDWVDSGFKDKAPEFIKSSKSYDAMYELLESKIAERMELLKLYYKIVGRSIDM
jgi:hypothetical protein